MVSAIRTAAREAKDAINPAMLLTRKKEARQRQKSLTA
jgi:hypothetical protein